METWKLLLGLTVVLLVFGGLATLTNTSLSSPWVIGVFVIALIASGVFYVTSRYGYRIGKRIGEDMQGDE